MQKISIALPKEMVAEVREAVKSGEYASSSEVVRDALRDWTTKRHLKGAGIEQLRELWQQARADEKPGVQINDVLDRLERKYRAMTEQ